MKILIVGGAGYVGGVVTDLLIKNKYNVTVYDSLLYEDQYMKDCPFILGDVRDESKLKGLLSKFDTVVWIAALVGDGACNIDPKLTNEINFKSVEFLSQNFNGRIVFFSTCSVYGAQNQLLNENSSVNPLSLYASTKLKAENALKNNNAIIFRLGTLFGLSDKFARLRMDLVVNTLTAKAFIENKINVFGGEQYRPLLHVRDAAKAIHESISSKEVGIFNLSLDNFKIIDIANAIKDHFPSLEILIEDIPFQDTRNYRVDNSKSLNLLNFKADILLLDGIKEIKKLLMETRIKDINNPRYTNQKYLQIFKPQ
jgi:nucleoside-diphosphate-sugar epimerase